MTKRQAKHGRLPPVRKAQPVISGLLDYFPDACLAVANCSFVANQQHNPGQPMHWNRNKSTDHADCLGRHLIDRGTLDTDGVRHSAKVAWRALAMLQTEIEQEYGGEPRQRHCTSRATQTRRRVKTARTGK